MPSVRCALTWRRALTKKLAEIVRARERQGAARLCWRHGVPTSRNRPCATVRCAAVLKVAKAAENPLSVLDDLEAGRLSTASVQTVRDLYPDLYAEMQQKVMDKVADNAAAGCRCRIRSACSLGCCWMCRQTPR